MNRIGRAIAVPRRIHAFRAAPLTKIALAKVAAIGVGIGNGRIVRIMLVLVLVLIFVFLAVPRRNDRRFMSRFGIVVLFVTCKVHSRRTFLSTQNFLDPIFQRTFMVFSTLCRNILFLRRPFFLSLICRIYRCRYGLLRLDLYFCCRRRNNAHEAAYGQGRDNSLLHQIPPSIRCVVYYRQFHSRITFKL